VVVPPDSEGRSDSDQQDDDERRCPRTGFLENVLAGHNATGVRRSRSGDGKEFADRAFARGLERFDGCIGPLQPPAKIMNSGAVSGRGTRLRFTF